MSGSIFESKSGAPWAFAVAPSFLLATPAAALTLTLKQGLNYIFRIHPTLTGRRFCGGGYNKLKTINHGCKLLSCSITTINNKLKNRLRRGVICPGESYKFFLYNF